MNDPVQAIKDKLSIHDLVSRYVKLKKAGRNYKGLCPFHQEKSPSFVVSPEKGIAYCFGCNKGGDVLAFYQLVEQCEFTDALQRLGQELGVEVKASANPEQLQMKKSQTVAIVEQHQVAVDFYQRQLWETEPGGKVLAYLKKRGLTEELIKAWQIGYAPDDRSVLLAELQHQGAVVDELLESGLVVAQDSAGSSVRDRFWQRLMIPIADDRDRWVGFGGRALQAEQQPKYLNSPETLIYQKQKILFGLNKAKDQLRKTRTVFLVEGYFDVFAFWLAQFPQAVATCGTALTEQHVKLLKRFVDTVVIAFDQDKAGQLATWRSAQLLFAAGLHVKVLLWQGGKDPADLVAENPELLKQAVESDQLDFWDYVWRVRLQSGELREDPRVVKELTNDLIDILRDVDPVIQDVYVRKVSQLLRLRPEKIYQQLKTSGPKNYYDAAPPEQIENIAEFKMSVEHLLWGYLAMVPELFAEFAEKLERMAEQLHTKAIYKAFALAYNDGRLVGSNLDHTELLQLPDQEMMLLNKLVLYLEMKDFHLWTKDRLCAELTVIIERLEDRSHRQKLEDVQWQIQAAEAQGDKEKRQHLLEQYMALLKSHSV